MPGAPAPPTTLRICCCRLRTLPSPSSAPPVFVELSYAVCFDRVDSTPFAASTTLLTLSAILEPSICADTVTLVSSLETVNDMPETTPEKVLDADVTVYRVNGFVPTV